jgi:eukaryotic-like serine/threonine-protein kinase
MSDFLSKFNKDKYNDLVDDKKAGSSNKEKPETDQQADLHNVQQGSLEGNSSNEVASTETRYSPTSRRIETTEEVEIDPTYQKKKRRKLLLTIIGALLSIVAIYFIYYNMVHVEVPDFTDKPVSEARSWTDKYNLQLDLTQEFSTEYEANRIFSQSISAGEKIRKGKTINIVSSKGPDPEELIPLPDFSAMNRYEIESWIQENKANNISFISEYSDEIQEGEFIRLVFRDSSVTEAEYRRRDNATIYFSRGKEVFEKNITVPNFVGKSRAEVEQWAETNSIEMTYEEENSSSVDAETIISQSVSPDEKVAKMDKMKVVVSLGRAIIVPNFGSLSMEEAMGQEDLMVTVKKQFHSQVPYGGLISQSISAGTKLTDKDSTNITVIYSEGRPYLKDFRGQLEGDLPSLFYDEYQSKGANIKYTVKVVDSSETKGTVVGMSKYNEFVPMNYTVEIRISNNKVKPQTQPEPPVSDIEEPAEDEPVDTDK